jgi:CheY-like chemotaxis protein
MINILIVDDDTKRQNKLILSIQKMEDIQFLNIVACTNANEAMVSLKSTSFDLMILDVVIPKRSDDKTPSSINGIKLLTDMHKKNIYLTPNKIIGITSFTDDLYDYRDAFQENTSVVLNAQYNDTRWISTIIQNIQSLINTDVQKSSLKKDSVLITLHGIRTYGNWQEKMQKDIRDRSSSFIFFAVKYGFFHIFAFLIPLFRKQILQNIEFSLEKIINDNHDKNIHIIAHSFGTYLIVKFLESHQFQHKISTLILAGSVLPRHTFKNLDLSSKVNKIINECGNNDYILLINTLFTPGLGDAGRVGFTTTTGSMMCNRFFKGGHSLYFNNNFYKTNWFPYLLSDLDDVETIDEREYKWYMDITEALIQFFTKIKITYLLLFFILARLFK